MSKRTVLNIAEKPSIAKLITKYLGQNQHIKLKSKSIYNPVWAFDFNFPDSKQSTMIVTSVSGHLQNKKFASQYSNWNSVNPKELLKNAEIHTHIDRKSNSVKIVSNLLELSGEEADNHVTDIILWLDCDREGEAIGFEVLETILRKELDKTNFDLEKLQDEYGIKIHRAQFSAATKGDIENAIENLTIPDINQKEVSLKITILGSRSSNGT